MPRSLAAIVLLAFLLLFAVAVSTWSIRTGMETERRDEEALIAHYASQGREVEIVETVEWPSYETCYRVKLHRRGAADVQGRVAMFSAGGPDLPYEFKGEFETLGECRTRFDRG